MKPTLCRGALISSIRTMSTCAGQIEMFALWWDKKVSDLCYQNNDTPLLVLSADNVSVDDGFLARLKTAYSSCSYLLMKRHDGKVMN